MRRTSLLAAAALVAVLAVPPPVLGAATNDNFADAAEVGQLPSSLWADLTGATEEAGEPACIYPHYGTVWFKYTATSAKPLSVAAYGYSPGIGIYTGASVDSLTQVACASWSGYSFQPAAGTTYYFQVADAYEGAMDTFRLEETPPPTVYLGINPYDPSTLDTMTFQDYTYDPYGGQVATRSWNLGDGTTSSEAYLTHRYAADGDYTVSLEVTMTDGRTASSSTVVSVRTRDASITGISAPTSAVVGKTIRITVSVSNRRAPQVVTVRLYRSIIGGTWTDVGNLTQTLPTMSKNKSVPFLFSYTVSPDDAVVGKLLFRAVAEVSGRDIFPADNEAITAPVRISR